ncbi:MAG TPA: hypothetical protein VGJ28_02555 [Micromonosporaceae bacterium]|jgi:archaellum component FlaF (FlaF/FlaG flagellin family)
MTVPPALTAVPLAELEVSRRPKALHWSAAIQLVVIAALVGFAILMFDDTNRFGAASDAVANRMDHDLGGEQSGGFLYWDLGLTLISLIAAAGLTAVVILVYVWPSLIARIPLIVANAGAALVFGGLATLTAAVAIFTTTDAADRNSNDYQTAVNAIYFGDMSVSLKVTEVLLAVLLIIGPIGASVLLLWPSVNRFHEGRVALRRFTAAARGRSLVPVYGIRR